MKPSDKLRCVRAFLPVRREQNEQTSQQKSRREGEHTRTQSRSHLAHGNGHAGEEPKAD